MVVALVSFAPNEPLWLTLLRRVALLVSTWLTAHIYYLLVEISRAVDTELDRSKAASDSAAAAATTSSADPLRAAQPTLKAGFSIPYVPPGTNTTHAWTSLGAEHFNVRCGPNYPRNGFKAASGPALGEVVAMDGLRTEKKIFDFLALNHVSLPDATPGWSEVYPEFIVINQMLPAKFHSSLITNESTDGETLNLIVYVRLKPGLARDYNIDQDPQNAEQLLKRFILLADQDPGVAHCLKEIGVVRNLDFLEESLPSSLFGLFKKFNGASSPSPRSGHRAHSSKHTQLVLTFCGVSSPCAVLFSVCCAWRCRDCRPMRSAGKPVLTRPEHYFHRDPQNRYFGIDLDGHRYKYMTRTALDKGLKHVERVKLGFGYVVEARKEMEMPEVMLCACEILMYEKSSCAKFPPSQS